MATDKYKLNIIKDVLTLILESDIIAKDDNNEYSDAFKYGYLKGTINTVIEFINEQQ
jgi:hypothetical protein